VTATKFGDIRQYWVSLSLVDHIVLELNTIPHGVSHDGRLVLAIYLNLPIWSNLVAVTFFAVHLFRRQDLQGSLHRQSVQAVMKIRSFATRRSVPSQHVSRRIL